MAHPDYTVVVGDRGRLVLPAAVRRTLELEPGTRMLLRVDLRGELHLHSYRAVAQGNRGMLVSLIPSDVSMVDELLEERRAEGARDAE